MEFSEYDDDLTKIDIFPNGKLFRLSFDSSVRKLKLICKRYDYLEDIRKSFSVDNSAAFFVSRYGYKVEAKKYAINKFGYFASGLVFEVLEWIKENFGDLSVLAISKNCNQYISDVIRPLKSTFENKLAISNISDDVGRNSELKRNGKTPFQFRDYQEASILHLLCKGYGRGLIEVPTAGGKSLILANFIWNILKHVDRNYRSLILVPNKQLVEQFYKDLIDYGYSPYELTRFTAGMKGKNAYNPEAKIIIANRQYVFLNKEKLSKIDVLICDEVHQCCSEATQNFIEELNCRIKIGCSGTLPRDKFTKWQLIGMFGRIVYTEDIVRLQKEGFISKLKITQIKIKDTVVEADRNILFHMYSLRKYRPDESGYSEVQFDEAHNAERDYFKQHYIELFDPVLKYLNTLAENILVLFEQIEVGKNLFEHARTVLTGKNLHYIDGSIDVKTREDIRTTFESSGNNVLFAQVSTFATGINIKRLSHICFAESSKSFSRVVQAIGRTLRLHSSKTEAHLIDVSFNYKYSQKHLAERLKIYRESYGKKTLDETLTFTI